MKYIYTYAIRWIFVWIRLHKYAGGKHYVEASSLTRSLSRGESNRKVSRQVYISTNIYACFNMNAQKLMWIHKSIFTRASEGRYEMIRKTYRLKQLKWITGLQTRGSSREESKWCEQSGHGMGKKLATSSEVIRAKLRRLSRAWIYSLKWAYGLKDKKDAGSWIDWGNLITICMLLHI